MTLDELRDVFEHLAPVVIFLIAILVVAEVCSRAGVFSAAGALVATWSRDSPVRLLTGTFLLAAAVLTDLSATLLSPVGTTAVLSALLGLNIGSGLTWTGSLPNLLWRRPLTRQGIRVGSREFHRVSLT